MSLHGSIRRACILGGFLVALVLAAGTAYATPSSTLWTNMTLDIQSYGVVHVGVDNDFTVARNAAEGGGSFPTDFGLTVGVLPFEKFQMEVGVDAVEASDNPVYFNLKMGSPEGVLFKGSPALELGLFNAGTKKDVTDQNVVDLIIGKSFQGIGRFSVGPYLGNDRVLVDSRGKKQSRGWMAAFDRGFHPVKRADGTEFNRFVVAADYASGRNAIGGGSIGAYTYFTKDISLLLGHVWFNDEGINGKPKWTIQLDINLPSWAGK